MTRTKQYKILQKLNKSENIYLRLPSKDMVLFRFLLEAYDNLALITVIEPKTTLIKLLYSSHEKERLETVLHSMRDLIDIKQLKNPFFS